MNSSVSDRAHGRCTTSRKPIEVGVDISAHLEVVG